MASAYFNRAMAREILERPGFETDYKVAARLNPKFDLESRRLDAQQLAQNQQSQQGKGSGSGSQGQSAANQNTSQQKNQGATAQASNSNNDEEEKEEQQRNRRRPNLIIEDTRDLPSENEEEVDDGRIQNQNIIIDLQPIFIVSAFEKNSVDYSRFQYYNMAIDELNAQNNYNPLLSITNKPAKQYKEVFENFVLYFNARLEISQNSHNYLNRGIFYSLTGNYNAALNDLNQAVSMNDDQAIAYFSRGNTRYKMLEEIELAQPSTDDVTVPLENSNSDELSDNLVLMPEYQKILDDYETLLYLKPKFFFGYYNRAYMKLRLREYKSAIEDLNMAIELEPEFAEAYFNRGLTKIFLNDIEGGALDLSRAGELGIHGAYNIIKRYCN